MAMEPNLSLVEAQAVVDTKTAPRVTEAFIKSQIAMTYFITNTEAPHLGTMTICVLTCINGFKVVGHSTPADERNFDAEVGRRYAYDNAFRQLWPMFGWRLRDVLSGPHPSH